MDFNPLKDGHKSEDAIAEDRITAPGKLIIQPFNLFIYNKIITNVSLFVLMMIGCSGRGFLRLLLCPEQHLLDLQEVCFSNCDTEIEIL